MAEETEYIKNEIEQFRIRYEGEYDEYYIGITNNLDRRLIEANQTMLEHLNNGEYTKDNPIYTEECINRDEAVTIEQFFQKKGMLKLNLRSVGVEDSRFIYCYKMTEENKKIVLSENSSDGKEMMKYFKKSNDFFNGK